MPPMPKLHLEMSARIERRAIGLETLLQVLRMHTLHPPVSDFLLQAATGECQPALIEELAEPVATRHPKQHWSAVRHVAKALFTFTKPGLRELPLCDAGEQTKQSNDTAGSVRNGTA